MKVTQLILILALFSLFFSCGNQPSEQNVSKKTAIKSPFYEGGYIASQGDSIYVKVMGSGAPILFIHGGPGLNHEYFLPHFKSLENDYQLIFYDQRASGKSSYKVDSNSVSLPGFLQDIENIRISLSIERWNVLGHSWGGLLAMQYAIAHEEKMESLILVNSSPASTELQDLAQAKSMESESPEELTQRREIINSMEFKNGDPKAYEKLYHLLFQSEFYDEKYLDSLHLSFPTNFAKASYELRYLAKDFSEYDVHMDLENLEIPALIIYGQIDPLTEISAADLEKYIPDSELIIIPNSGHFPFIESKETFFSSLRSFLGAPQAL